MSKQTSEERAAEKEAATALKTLKKLGKTELARRLTAAEEQTAALQEQVAALQSQLADRTLAVEQSGSLADAALKVNGVFEAAQAACAQYEENIRARSAEQESLSAQKLQQTEQQCQAMLAEAQTAAQQYWDDLYTRLEQYRAEHRELNALFESIPSAVPAPAAPPAGQAPVDPLPTGAASALDRFESQTT